MARFDVCGLDDIIRDMTRFGEIYGDTANEMLGAGAEIVKAEWIASAQRHNLKDTGQMIDSIFYNQRPEKITDILVVDVYPQGKRKYKKTSRYISEEKLRKRNKVTNAEVAFVLNYGRPGIFPATHWVDDADIAAEPYIYLTFQEIWDKRVRERNL